MRNVGTWWSVRSRIIIDRHTIEDITYNILADRLWYLSTAMATIPKLPILMRVVRTPNEVIFSILRTLDSELVLSFVANYYTYVFVLPENSVPIASLPVNHSATWYSSGSIVEPTKIN